LVTTSFLGKRRHNDLAIDRARILSKAEAGDRPSPSYTTDARAI
jgi:hypothetical protein